MTVALVLRSASGVLFVRDVLIPPFKPLPERIQFGGTVYECGGVDLRCVPIYATYED